MFILTFISKNLIPFGSIIILFILYTNCAPSFQSSGSNNQSNSSIDDILSSDTILKNAIINRTKLRNVVQVTSSGDAYPLCDSTPNERTGNHSSALSRVELFNSLKNIIDISVNSELYTFF